MLPPPTSVMQVFVKADERSFVFNVTPLTMCADISSFIFDKVGMYDSAVNSPIAQLQELTMCFKPVTLLR
jgi:hypothetical protein